MATKKKTSQAQRAASGSTKTTAGKNTKKGAKAAPQKQTKEKVKLPARLISSMVIAGLFVLFLVMFLNPDGALVKLAYSFVQGLFGRVAFYEVARWNDIFEARHQEPKPYNALNALLGL